MRGSRAGLPSLSGLGEESESDEHFYARCKVVGCASSVWLLPAALGPSFLDKGVGTSLIVTQFSLACA